jgi:pimeloyl-ACP methyl ester carboxylesterase
MRAGIVGLGFAALVVGVGCGDDGETTVGSGGADGSGAAGATTGSSTASGSSVATTSGAGGEGEGGSGGAATIDLSIEWEPCPLYSNGQEGRTVECATIQVPSKWDDPASERIDFFVKRVPALEQPARAQVWYLQGGPGYGGDAFDPLADIYDDVVTDVDQYIPDHRGTARSSRLGCYAELPESVGGPAITSIEWTTCFEELRETWGDALEGFNVTNAARDVGEVIAATRAEDQQVIVFGGSYGSIWANRYLVLYPDQPTAVGMSALAIHTQLDSMDRWFNGLGERWMAACAEDEVCGERLGPDPWATMTETLDDLDAGSCPRISNAFDRRTLQQIWTSFYYGWGERALIAPMVYRIDRCADEDVAAFDHLFDLLTTPEPADPTAGYFSLLLSGTITLSELWSDPPPTVEEIDAYRDEANVAHGLPGVFAAQYDAWPRYTPDEHAGALAPPADHMLLFSGDFDFIPQEARQATIDHFESDTRPFLLLPRASHGLGASPIVGELSCGLQLVQSFISDPEGTADLDASCLDRIAPIDWDPSGAPVTADYLGVDDAWDGAPVVKKADQSYGKPSPPIPWRVERELAPVRERLRAIRSTR